MMTISTAEEVELTEPTRLRPDPLPTKPLLTKITYPTQSRFDRPVPPVFGAGGSILSIGSLLVMSGLSAVMLWKLIVPGAAPLGGLLPDPVATGAMPTWVWLPFAFTVFGATIGWMLELGLLIKGTPFDQGRNRFTSFVRQIRLLNLAPVVTTILFFVVSMSMATAGVLQAALLGTAAMGTGLGFALFFGGANKGVPAILMGTQLAQVALVLVAPAAQLNAPIIALLAIQALLQLSAFLVGTATPIRSTAFHLISTASGLLLFLAVVRLTAIDPAFVNRVAIPVPPGSALFWGVVAACVAGLWFTARVSRRTYNNWRAAASNGLWSVIYFFLLSQKRFQNPLTLNSVYGARAPQPTALRPYYEVHGEYLPQALSIPAAEKLEGNVAAMQGVVTMVRKAFTLIAQLDHKFPQADVNVPLAQKPRLPVWSDGSEFYPRLFLRKIFGATVPGPGLEATPQPAIQAFKEGQLLAYLAESGVASPLLSAAPERGPGHVKLDLRHLENYETKPDYEPYGGVAYFSIDAIERKLVLDSVVGPKSSETVSADPHDPTFRRIESMILASMYFEVISGKHLAAIHMTYNLVEVAMHNAFDAQGKWTHPFRTLMYLHFFSHELAEELTTEHLVQKGAVFNQIFATTYDGMINHLNDTFHNFEYTADEDFEARADLLSVGRGENREILPHAAIGWELQYAEVWQSYSRRLIDAIYPNDAAVENDVYLQAFHNELCGLFRKGLPARHEGLKTKAGVARYVSDTIHHVVIRHQVYGTTGVKAAMDPRLSSTQVPKDAGTPGVEEWRSLICVALATARARFTLLMGDFKYLLDDVDKKYRQPMRDCFDQLQEDLRKLDEQWTRTEADKEFNYNRFRPLPSALHTGPGY